MWKLIVGLAIVGLIVSIIVTVNDGNSKVRVANAELTLVKQEVATYISTKGIEPTTTEEVTNKTLTGQYEIVKGEIIGKEYG
jgi:hypothetical protein